MHWSDPLQQNQDYIFSHFYHHSLLSAFRQSNYFDRILSFTLLFVISNLYQIGT